MRSESPGEGRLRAGRLARVPVLLAALAALGFGVAATSGLWADLAGRMVAGNVPDGLHYSWWLGHTPHALGLRESPFQTLDLNWPEGVSAMNNTTLLLPAVLLLPVTLLADSLVTLNVLNALAVPACALGGYWALRQVPWNGSRLSRSAALTGAVTFAISPAIVNSLVGHVTMAFAPALPVLVALSVKAWHGEHPVRTGLVLGAVTTLQVFTGEEVLFQAAVGAAVVIVVGFLSRPRSAPAAALRLLKALVAAFAVFLPLAGYPLYLQFLGPRKQHGSPFLLDYYGADVTSFTTPTGQLLLHTQASAAAALKFPGGLEEHLAYLGWPLLVVCLLTALIGWRSVPVRAAAAGLAFAMALSLGGRLWVRGEWTERRGPYAFFQHLPVTEASLATRFGLLAALFAGALLAFAVHTVAARWRRGGGLVAGVLAVACLAPLVPTPLTTVEAPAVPAYFAGRAAQDIPKDSVVVVLPYPVAGNPVGMRWQSAAGYRFRMPGGYFLGPAQDGHAYVGGSVDPATARLLTDVADRNAVPAITQADREQAAQDLNAWGASRIVLGPSPSHDALKEAVTQLLGREPVTVDGVDVWGGPELQS